MLSQKSILLAILFSVLFIGKGYSQSSSYSSSTELISVQIDSLNTEQRIQLTVNFTDINSIGGLAFSVYNATDGSFLFEVNSTVSELQTSGMLVGSQFKLDLLPYEAGKNIRIDLNPFSIGGLFIERSEIVTTY